MARGRKFRSTRRIPDTERSLFEQKLTGRYSRTLDRTDLLGLIRGGEDTHLEFKIRLVNTEKVVAEIVVLQVDDRRAPHQTPDHRYFIRIGSTKREAEGSEIAALFARSRVASLEDMPLVTAAVEDVDEALVWSYIRDLEGETFREPDGFPTALAMRDLRLAADYGGSIAPSLAGFLLFGRSAAVQQIVPQSQITLTRFSGKNTASPVVERAEFCGNVTRLFDKDR